MSPSRQQQRAQEARRQARHQEAARHAARLERRRRLLGAGVVVAVLLATLLAVVQATGEDERSGGPTTTTSLPGDGPTTSERPPVSELALPPTGDTIAGDVPCPAEDGSSERTTSFAQEPPICLVTLADGSIDPAVRYRAVMRTTAGDLTFLLNTDLAPRSVNAFVVLARYGYFDGAPFDKVLRTSWAEFGGAFADGGDDVPGGFTVPGEAPEQGTIAVPGGLAIAPGEGGDGSTSFGGRFVLALGENAAELPPRTAFFGIMLDGTEAFSALHRAGTSSGRPAEVITIESVEVVAEPKA